MAQHVLKQLTLAPVADSRRSLNSAKKQIEKQQVDNEQIVKKPVAGMQVNKAQKVEAHSIVATTLARTVPSGRQPLAAVTTIAPAVTPRAAPATKPLILVMPVKARTVPFYQMTASQKRTLHTQSSKHPKIILKTRVSTKDNTCSTEIAASRYSKPLLAAFSPTLGEQFNEEPEQTLIISDVEKKPLVAIVRWIARCGHHMRVEKLDIYAMGVEELLRLWLTCMHLHVEILLDQLQDTFKYYVKSRRSEDIARIYTLTSLWNVEAAVPTLPHAFRLYLNSCNMTITQTVELWTMMKAATSLQDPLDALRRKLTAMLRQAKLSVTELEVLWLASPEEHFTEATVRSVAWDLWNEYETEEEIPGFGGIAEGLKAPLRAQWDVQTDRFEAQQKAKRRTKLKRHQYGIGCKEWPIR